MRWFFLLVCFTLFLNLIKAANILAVFPLAAKSHFIMFQSLVEELAKRGHEVDVMSHFPLKEPIKGYNDISLLGTQPLFTNNLTMDLVKQVSGNHIISMYFMLWMGGVDTCAATFNADVAKNLRNSNKKYDLVITEVFTTDCMLGWGYHFGAPVISMSSSELLPWVNDRIGNPDNPSYIPNHFGHLLPEMTLYERFVNTYYYLITKFIYKYVSERNSNRLAKEFFGQDMPDLSELSYNTSLILVNSHASINQARPTVPNCIDVAGIHIGKPKPLNKHFLELLTTDSNGIIYLTMGSMVMTETFPPEIIQGMFDAFAELPYKVIWKADKENFPKGLRFPKNIHFEKWFPQFDILCNPNVKLFVTHGGLMGTQEAIYCGVPRLGIPLFGDQEINIKSSEALGIAKKITFDDINKESFLEALTELVSNPKYQENAKLISEKFKDRPMSPLDTAVYWTEYVIKYKGAPHLRSIGRKLPWYQYHLLDVTAILVLITVFSGYSLLYIIRLCFNKRKNPKSKKD